MSMSPLTPEAPSMEDLERLCGSPRRARLRAWRKRAAWRLVVGGASALKRTVDVVVSAAGLAALAPVFALVAAAIKLTDNGPVLFWQTRVGQWGREFPFPKFRSMCLDAEQKKTALLAANDHGGSVTFKMKRDPRITAVGRIIRKLSIDEMPQLWLVLKGDMSLVGPRPPVPREVAEYTLADRRRLDAKPGLTCIWQVSGRSEIGFQEWVRMDLRYAQRRSTLLELGLMFRTIKAVVSGRGAY